MRNETIRIRKESLKVSFSAPPPPPSPLLPCLLIGVKIAAMGVNSSQNIGVFVLVCPQGTTRDLACYLYHQNMLLSKSTPESPTALIRYGLSIPNT